MRVALAVLLLFPVLAHAVSIEGSGVVKTELRTVPEFSAVECGGVFELSITCGKAAKCELSGDDNILPVVTTTVADGKLTIATTGAISTKQPLKATLELPELKALSMSGAGTATIADAKGESFALDISGTANVTAAGQVKLVKIKLSGAGKAAAVALKAEHAEVDCSGAGSIEIFASETLTADVSGVGSVRFAGDPKTVKKQISGVGSVSPN